MEVLVGDTRRFALVKLIRLAILFESESKAALGIVVPDVAAKLLRSHQCSQKDKENSDSHFRVIRSITSN